MARGNNPLLNKLSGNLGDYSVAQVSGKSVLRARPTVSAAQSAAQSAQRALVGGLGQMWKSLDADTQNGWLLLGMQMTGATGKPLTGFRAFMSVNTALATLGDPFITDAPLAPDAPTPMPPVLLLQGVYDTSGDFSLTLSGPAYSGFILVGGAAPTLAGRDMIPDAAFKPLGKITSVGSATNLTALYTARFGIPQAGAKVAVTVMPVSGTGFRGVTRMVTAVVTADAVQKTVSGDGALRKAA